MAAMMRYDVYRHGYGCKVIQRGPMSGCPNFAGHTHEKLNKAPMGLTRAQAMADADAHHVQVYLRNGDGGTTKVYDNGKDPFTPEGWLAAAWNGRL